MALRIALSLALFSPIAVHRLQNVTILLILLVADGILFESSRSCGLGSSIPWAVDGVRSGTYRPTDSSHVQYSTSSLLLLLLATGAKRNCLAILSFIRDDGPALVHYITPY